MRTIPLEFNQIAAHRGSNLAYEFNRRLNHIGNNLVKVIIYVDEYAPSRDFATRTYDYLTITAGNRWGLHVMFQPTETSAPVTVDLTRLVYDGGINHRMGVTSLDHNTRINQEYITEQLLASEVEVITRYGGWSVVTMVMEAYASVLNTHATMMFMPFTLPNSGEANVMLVTAGRTPDTMNQYYIVTQVRPDGVIATDVRSRFYGSRMSDDLDNIIQFRHYQNGADLTVLNTWLPISWFVKDLYLQVNATSHRLIGTEATRIAVYDLPQVYNNSVLNSPRFHKIKEALKQTYFKVDTLQRFFGFEFEKCAITGKFFAKLGTADPDMYETMYTIYDGPTLQPVSVYAIRKIVGRLIIAEECEECDTYVQTGRFSFYKAIQDRYSHIFGTVGEFTSTRFGILEIENQTEDLNTIRLFHDLHDIADSEYPDHAPDYYCDVCGRGEDYYDEDEDNDHRNEYLGSYQIDKLKTIAEANGKQLVHRDGFPFFTDDTDAFNSDFQWRNFNKYEVNEYSYRPSITFINGDCMEKTKLYMGVEWEMDNGGELHRKAVAINSALSNNQPYSWTMTDGSLHNGIEIATMPATLDAHTNVFNWDLACKAAVSLGYRAHDTSTAGIHVHINRNFFSDDKKLQLYRASLMALVMERNWDDFVKFSRRRYNRLDQWAKKKKLADNLQADITTDGMVDRVNEEYGNGDKYLAINLRNSNTFELRIFRGTLKPDSIKATLQFVSNLANFCKYNNLAKAQTATFEDIINYKEYPELKAYWEENKNREVNE